MNNPYSRNIQLNSSGLGCFLTFILIAALLTSVGLGWIVNGFIILMLLIPVTIALGIFGFQWWLKRNLVEDACPVCSYRFTGLNNAVAQCPSCGEPIQIVDRSFQRRTPPGTVDVSAVDVEASTNQPTNNDVIDVDVKVIESGDD